MCVLCAEGRVLVLGSSNGTEDGRNSVFQVGMFGLETVLRVPDGSLGTRRFPRAFSG